MSGDVGEGQPATGGQGDERRGRGLGRRPHVPGRGPGMEPGGSSEARAGWGRSLGSSAGRIRVGRGQGGCFL